MSSESDELLEQFRKALKDCEQLYASAGQLCAEHHPNLISQSPREFIELMNDLHKGLVVKVYISIAEADRRWSPQERRLAEELFQHVWKRHLTGDSLRNAVIHVSHRASEMGWYSLVRPFARLAPLRQRIAHLETVVMRLANLVARSDGPLASSETAYLRTLQAELDRHLHPLPLDAPGHHEAARSAGTQAVRKMRSDVSQLRRRCEIQSDSEPPETDDKAVVSREEQFKAALAQLDELIGMSSVKSEVRTLTNFLNVQRQRTSLGLPETDVSLHMVFVGNPGTGKTTVARIVGRIYGAMGLLDRGHLIETDRSGLVAEYAGQTGPKTNRKIDEALDGVLFVDEAYGLVAEKGDDPYGREAVQTLLKRMEDDRRRLVVILAGYPEPMDRLLHSNPGLSSRFQRTLAFEDYGCVELCRIFELMCRANHYDLPAATRARLLWGFKWLHEHRDEHFGNGRLVRNVFEDAIRRLANRVAAVKTLTKELLTVLQPSDIHLGVRSEMWEPVDGTEQKFRVQCSKCKVESSVSADYLGRRLKCNRCNHRFVAAWGEPLTPD